ncbi:M23 family metallopeptidase [Owenweeksia hongkongensis]|uniref:Metalloendopeptidase-like membrane protein n=1 Tax=Owenweeksia hongkongensis (strain DSM 17368 / CIP 108786 / JCM 12287 / NRRL B-23963 / UST20020801) TaxID=926562 RepID=G8R6B2_OWEHD|nr:M23 family metallopeptidase [Owenweeksia hongkongensis]AEV33332.1 metalloendopeptidase-like membrane protein [Owenweeksia hongkongensis DSM 17368]
MAKEKNQRKISKKLRNKYRLVILNDDTFEEKLSLKLSRLNVFVLAGFLFIFLITATTLLISFTPLREYIPGYSSTALRRKAFELSLTTDSLERQLTYNQRYLLNIKNIVEGKPTINFADTAMSDSIVQAEINKSISKEDSLLRLMVEEEEQFNINSGNRGEVALKNISFFTPVKGLVTNDFNPKENHLGVDIVAKKNEVVKACQEGIVIFSEWTSETGYTLIIQHRGNFISAYKHNSSLLKQQGENVNAGEPIAIIGNSGELTTGPHLHFELWYDGHPVNPEDYISF